MSARYAKHAPNTGAKVSLMFFLAWCPKFRRPVLSDEIAPRLAELLYHRAAELEITIHTLEIKPDNIRLLVQADQTFSVSEIVSRLKRETSRVLRAEYPSLRSRLPTLWNRRFYATSVGAINTDLVDEFVENQKGK